MRRSPPGMHAVWGMRGPQSMLSSKRQQLTFSLYLCICQASACTRRRMACCCQCRYGFLSCLACMLHLLRVAHICAAVNRTLRSLWRSTFCVQGTCPLEFQGARISHNPGHMCVGEDAPSEGDDFRPLTWAPPTASDPDRMDEAASICQMEWHCVIANAMCFSTIRYPLQATLMQFDWGLGGHEDLTSYATHNLGTDRYSRPGGARSSAVATTQAAPLV